MKKNKEFELPKEVVTVKFIPHKKGMASNVGDDHVISGGMLDKATLKYYAPRQRNGKIANILSLEEKEHLEKLMGGSNLSVYGDFWEDYSVSLFKNDNSNKFYLEDPIDYIAIRLLESNEHLIAKSWSERGDKQTYRFAITREDELMTEEKGDLDTKMTAWALYGSMKDDKSKLIGALRLLGNKPVSVTSRLEWVQNEVQRHVDTNSVKFISVVNDSSFETRRLINDAIDSGYIVKRGNKYGTKDGLELSEKGSIPSFNNAVTYLDQDKNQEIRSVIEAKVAESK